MTDASFSSARVARALASTVVTHGVNIAQTFLLVPLFLAAWGSEGYGRWLSLIALVSYLGLVDLGGQQYIANQLGAAFAKNDPDEFRTTLSRGVSIYSVLGAGVSLLAALLLLVAAGSWDLDSKLVVLLYSLQIAVQVPGGVIGTAYSGSGRVVRYVNIGSSVALLALGLSVVALIAHVSQPLFAGLQLLCAMIGIAVCLVDLPRQIPDLFRPKLSLAALRETLPLLRGSLPYWVFALAAGLSMQGVVLVVSASAGPDAVAAFATHRSAASLILYAAGLLRPALWTELTFLAARGDFTRMRFVVTVAVRTSTWFAAVIGSVICLAAPLGYALWTHSKLELNTPLLVLLAARAILSAGWSAVSWPLISANRPRALARWTLINALLTVAGGYVCMRLGGGLVGLAAWSLAVDVVCALIPFPIAASAFMQTPVRSFFADVARAILCGAPFGALAYACLVRTDDILKQLVAFGLGASLLAWPCLRALYGARDFGRIQTMLLRAVRSERGA